MKGYEVPIVLFVAADNEDTALERARKIANRMHGRHYHGCEMEAESLLEPNLVVIPEFGA